MNKLELQKMANEVRKGIITGVHSAKAGHPGGSLSAADIFTYLYFEEMNVDPAFKSGGSRQRSFCTVKRPYGPRSVRSTGPSRIFPCGGSGNIAPYRFSSSGTSLHQSYAGH